MDSQALSAQGHFKQVNLVALVKAATLLLYDFGFHITTSSAVLIALYCVAARLDMQLLVLDLNVQEV